MANTITCPHCHRTFPLEEALSGQLEAHYQAEFTKKLEEQQLNQKKEQDQRVAEERVKAQQEALLQVEEKMKTLEEENEKRKQENLALRQKEIDLLRKEKLVKEREEELQLNLDKQMLERQDEIEMRAIARAEEAFALEKAKLLKQIDDNKKLAEEMKRKAEQGSMQLQGESLELAVERVLGETYPFDRIEEVPKGIRGADCIQTVINSSQQVCGRIVYESKTTKAFGNDWIDKLKQDQLSCKADIAVLVTQSYPKDMDRFGEKDGVWICSFDEVRSVSFVLRQMLIRVQGLRSTEENKGEKKELLYRYFTSGEFVQNVKRIVENYDKMTDQLNREKKAMHKLWSERESQIWTVQENLAALFGRIKGITGEELPDAGLLEMPVED